MVIVGGGNSAGQAAVFLARYADQVTLVVRKQDLGEYMSRYLIDQVRRIPNVRILLGTEVRELLGDEALEAIAVEDRETGERAGPARGPCSSSSAWHPAPAGSVTWLTLTITASSGPGTDTSPAACAAAENGWQRSMLETSRPGIFAVGDVRGGSAKRVAAAVGEGAMSIRLAFERMRPT